MYLFVFVLFGKFHHFANSITFRVLFRPYIKIFWFTFLVIFRLMPVVLILQKASHIPHLPGTGTHCHHCAPTKSNFPHHHMTAAYCPHHTVRAMQCCHRPMLAKASTNSVTIVRRPHFPIKEKGYNYLRQHIILPFWWKHHHALDWCCIHATLLYTYVWYDFNVCCSMATNADSSVPLLPFSSARYHRKGLMIWALSNTHLKVHMTYFNIVNTICETNLTGFQVLEWGNDIVRMKTFRKIIPG